MTGNSGAHRARVSAGQDQRWADIAPAVVLMVVGVFALAITSVLTVTVPGQYLVMAAPGTGRGDVMDLVYRAGGGVVGFGGFSNIAIAVSDDPGFKASVLASGAWVAIPSPRLLGCVTGAQGETP